MPMSETSLDINNGAGKGNREYLERNEKENFKSFHYQICNSSKYHLVKAISQEWNWKQNQFYTKQNEWTQWSFSWSMIMQRDIGLIGGKNLQLLFGTSLSPQTTNRAFKMFPILLFTCYIWQSNVLCQGKNTSGP